MNLVRLIDILNTKDVITTRELNSLGFNSHSITKLIDECIISRKERGIYEVGSVDCILEYANKYIIEGKNDEAKVLYNYCYKLEPYNYNASILKLFDAISYNDRNNVYKYFRDVYKDLISNGRINDANYLLYLYSYYYGIPVEYMTEFNKFMKNIEMKSDDSIKYDVREAVYNNKYQRADGLINDGEYSFDSDYENLLEKKLIENCYVKACNFNNTIEQLILNDNYENARKRLLTLKKDGFLNHYQTKLLYLLNVYYDMNFTGNIPMAHTISDSNNFYLCLECNQFEQAKNLLDAYYDSCGEDKNSISMYCLLSKVTELINDLGGQENIDDLLISRTENKIKRLNDSNPIVLLDPVDSKDDLDKIFEIVNNNSNLIGFVINTSNGIQPIVKVYHEDFDENPNDLREQYRMARTLYDNKRYEESLKIYKHLLTVGKPHAGVYAGCGFCLFKLDRYSEAIDFFRMATGVSILDGGSLNYDSFIKKLSSGTDINSHSIYDNDFFEHGLKIDASFINDLIGLANEGEFNFDEALDKLRLNELQKNYARLIYARDCYFVGDISLGDKYLYFVEKSSSKNGELDKVIKLLRKRKRFLQNRLDDDKSQLILLK